MFHAVSAFNIAGFSTNADSLVGYVTDPWISFTIAGKVILGALGFPWCSNSRGAARQFGDFRTPGIVSTVSGGAPGSLVGSPDPHTSEGPPCPSPPSAPTS